MPEQNPALWRRRLVEAYCDLCARIMPSAVALGLALTVAAIARKVCLP